MLYTMVWTELVYQVWVDRCKMVYKGTHKGVKVAAKEMMFRVAARVSNELKMFLFM